MKFKIVLLLVAIVAAFSSFAFSAPAFADTSVQEVCGGLQAISGDRCDPGAGGAKISRLLQGAINYFSIVLGIISVFIIMIAGNTLITSGGDSSKVTKAREAIMYASIGLLIVALAQIFAHFVLKVASTAS